MQQPKAWSFFSVEFTAGYFDSPPEDSYKFSEALGAVWFHDGLLSEVEVHDLPLINLEFASPTVGTPKQKKKRDKAKEKEKDEDDTVDSEISVPANLVKCGLSELVTAIFAGFDTNLLSDEPGKMVLFLETAGLVNTSRQRIFANQNYPAVCKKKSLHWQTVIQPLQSAFGAAPTKETIIERIKSYTEQLHDPFDMNLAEEWLVALKFDDEKTCIRVAANILSVVFRLVVKNDQHMMELGQTQSWTQIVSLSGLLKKPSRVAFSSASINELKDVCLWLKTTVTLVTMTCYIKNPNFCPVVMAAYMQRFLYYAFNPWLNLAKIQTELGVYPAEVLGYFYTREMIVSITALMTAVKLYGSSDTESQAMILFQRY
ncbi:unnamed protein product [Toxocara canis]|uniref:Uncharacterized protein n=1 Tax=Toxocara canis TaxID=6265 RepID=A0A3P7F0S0_TOXCA|nr:unnamed protein product [Toxocara canis]